MKLILKSLIQHLFLSKNLTGYPPNAHVIIDMETYFLVFVKVVVEKPRLTAEPH